MSRPRRLQATRQGRSQVTTTYSRRIERRRVPRQISATSFGTHPLVLPASVEPDAPAVIDGVLIEEPVAVATRPFTLRLFGRWQAYVARAKQDAPVSRAGAELRWGGWA